MENGLSTEKLVSYYEEFESNTFKARELAEQNRDYYDNKQWTEQEASTLEKRKQPVVTFNLVKRTIDALLGYERQNRTDPRALPRTPQHEEDAEVCTDALRYVMDNNDFDQVSSDAFEFLLLEGVEAADIQVEDRGEQLEVAITCINWDRLFWDVHSRKKDFSDAKYKGIVIWMDYEDAKARWGEKAQEAINVEEPTFGDTTHEDRPQYKWNDSRRKRIKVCLIYYKHNGVWHYEYFNRAAKLKGGVSPYLDEHGKPECPIEMQSAFIDRDANRYGYAKTLISPQDEVNKRRSKALHLISQRQTFGNKASGIDALSIKEEMAKPDGHIEMTHGEFGKDFGIVPTTDMAQGNFQLLQEAKEIFNVVGANTSVTGKEDRVMSGRAEIIRQQAGIRELAPVMDAHSHWKKRVYRQVWNRIRQYWTEKRWVRVTDDEKSMKWVGVNQPITLGQQLENELPPEELQYIDPNDPRLQQVVGVQNQLSKLDVDILIEESPDIATIQEEQFDLIAKMYQANPQVIPFESVVKLSSLRNKDEFLEEIKGNKEMQARAAQKAAQVEELAQAKEVSEIEKTRSETAKNEATALEKMSNVAAI